MTRCSAKRSLTEIMIGGVVARKSGDLVLVTWAQLRQEVFIRPFVKTEMRKPGCAAQGFIILREHGTQLRP